MPPVFPIKLTRFFFIAGLILFQPLSSQALPPRGVPGDLWADLILGQPTFGDDSPNQVSNKGLFNPFSSVVDRVHNILWVYDSGNNRVLGVSNLGSLTSGQGADIVLGQIDFNHSSCNGDSNWQTYPTPPLPTASCLCGLRYDLQSPAEGGSAGNMAVDDQGNLYVPDYYNNRVLRYDWPITSGQSASRVWGQPDFVSYQYNNIGGNTPGSPSASNLNFYPNLVSDNHYYAGAATDNWGNLWVADASNNRVVRYPNPNVPAVGVPLTAADVVLGQNNFTSAAFPANAADLTHLRHPGAVRVDSAGNVFVTDLIPNGISPFYFGGRVLVYKPTGTDASGQPRYGATNMGLTANGAITQYMDQVDGLEWDPSGDLWVSQYYQIVLLHFTLSPTVSASAVKVLMQAFPIGPGGVSGTTGGDGPDFIDNAGETSSSASLAQQLGGAVGVDSLGNVYAPGGRWQDVLRFQAPIPALGSLPAGQAHSANLQIFKPNQWRVMNNIGNNGLFISAGVAVGGGQIIESNVNRLAFWNIPSGPSGLTNGQAPDGFAGTTAPNLWITNPFGRVETDHAAQPHLWVIHNVGGTVRVEPYFLPLTNGALPIPGGTLMPPLPVLGGGTVSWTAMEGIAPDPSGNFIWLSDKIGNRVFRVRNPLTSPVVDIILGQPNASSTGCNVGGTLPSNELCTSGVLNSSTLYVPGAIRLDHHGNLFVSDHSLEDEGNYRMFRFNSGAIQNNSPTTPLYGVPASAVYGTNGSYTQTGCYSSNGVCAPWESALNADDTKMVTGMNSQGPGLRFPVILSNPLTGDSPAGQLGDFGPQSFSSTFDDQDNLYVTELNRNRVLVYLQPFGPPTPLPTLTPTPTGSPTYTPTFSPTQTPTPTITFTPIPAGVYFQRINAGGGAIVSTDGRSWTGDQVYTPGSFGNDNTGFVVQGGCIPEGMSGADYPLFRTIRYNGLMEYKFDVPRADTYQVTLYFTECFHSPGESRIFSVSMEGVQVDQFDLVPLAVAPDGKRYLITKTYNVTLNASDLTLNILFQGINDNAVISAIEVVGTSPLYSPTPTGSATYTATPSPTGTFTFTPSPTRTFTWTPSPTPSYTYTPTGTLPFTLTYTPTATPTLNCCQPALSWTTPTLSGASQAAGVAVDSLRGRVYVADENAGQVKVLNYTGAAVTNWSVVDAFGVAVGTCSSDGVYVSRRNQGTVSKLDAAGNILFTSAFLSGGLRLISVDLLGNLYTSSDSGHIYELDSGGVLRADLIGSGALGAMSAPTQVLKIGLDLFVVDTLKNRVIKFTETGVNSYIYNLNQTPVVASLSAPYGISFDLAGNIYVTTQTSNGYTIYDSAWAPLKNCVVSQGGAFGVALDELGTIYVAARSANTVAKMQPCFSQPPFLNCSPTPTRTFTLTVTPTPTWTTTFPPTDTFTLTPTLTNTASLTPTPSATSSLTDSPTLSPTWTATLSPTETPTKTPTESLTPTPSATSSLTNSPTSTPTSTFTSTGPGSATATSTPSNSPTVTVTSTPPTSPSPILYPNPVTLGGTFSLGLSLTGPANVKVRIFTTAFRKILEQNYPQVPAGVNPSIPLVDKWGTDLANGFYFVVVDIDDKRSILKLLILK